MLVGTVWFNVISMTENLALAHARQGVLAVEMVHPMRTSCFPSPSALFCGMPVMTRGGPACEALHPVTQASLRSSVGFV